MKQRLGKLTKVHLFLFFHYFPEPTKTNRRIFAWRGFSPARSRKMSASSSGGALKDLVHPSLNEALKTHNGVTFKLVKTGELNIILSKFVFVFMYCLSLSMKPTNKF